MDFFLNFLMISDFEETIWYNACGEWSLWIELIIQKYLIMEN